MTSPPLPGNFQENLKTLPDEATTPHLTSLIAILRNFSSVLTSQEENYLLPYTQVICDSLDCLLEKHKLDGLDKIDFPLTIAQNNSGFPTVKDFYTLKKDKDEAGGILQQLPSREGVIDKIRSSILRGSSPVNAQMMLLRYNFYKKLSQTEMLEEYHLGKPELIKEENGRRFYTINWSCIGRSTNLPVFHRMYFTHDRNSGPPLEKGLSVELRSFLYQTQWGPDLKFFAATLDNEIKEIHPKAIERVYVGPFYNQYTNNSDELNSLFNGMENPSLLKVITEKIRSDRVSQYGNWLDMITGKKTEREVFSPVFSETKIITSFRLKQLFGERDELGNPCKVYGSTKDGGIA